MGLGFDLSPSSKQSGQSKAGGRARIMFQELVRLMAGRQSELGVSGVWCKRSGGEFVKTGKIQVNREGARYNTASNNRQTGVKLYFSLHYANIVLNKGK